MEAFKEHQSDEEEEEEEVEDDLTFTDLHSVLLTTTHDEAQNDTCALCPHHRCTADALNQIANNEVVKSLASDSASRVEEETTSSYLQPQCLIQLLPPPASRRTVFPLMYNPTQPPTPTCLSKQR